MNRIFLVLFILLPVVANAQSWAWAKGAGSIGDDVASSITTDASGFIYMTGRYDSPTITFGSFTLTNIGSSFSTYLVKYDSLGTVIWARSIDGVTQPSFVTADSFGHVYLTGTFGSSSITFGITTLTNDSSGGYGDIFLVKYDSSGNVLWAKSAGGTKTDQSYAIASDVRGNVYVAGSMCSSTMTVGASVLTNDTTNGSSDILLIKYDSVGNVVWAKSAGGSSGDMAQSVCVDRFGDVYVTGRFMSTTLIIGTTTLTNAGSYDMFLAKYDSVGSAVWATGAGGSGFDYGTSATTNALGDIYVTGIYTSTSVTFGTTTLTNAYSTTDDVFLVKYNSAGGVQWARSAGGVGNDDPTSVATDVWGNVYVAGGSSTSFTFDTAMLSGGAFLLKYTASGTQKWAECNGLGAQAGGYSVATYGWGNVYVAGDYRTPTITFGTNTVTNGGSGVTNDIFLVRLDDITLDDPALNISHTASQEENAFVYPNPATTSITISSTDKITSITITNLIGQTVYNNNYHSEEVQVDVSGLPTGMYLVRINGTEVRKFVKE